MDVEKYKEVKKVIKMIKMKSEKKKWRGHSEIV
jgi:hypothetical protein